MSLATAAIEHLERQLVSARRLLGLVLAQTEAIKAQDVEALLARLADVQLELATRDELEAERDRLLQDAAVVLGKPVHAVDVDALVAGAPAGEADRARALSAELRGLLLEIGRVHGQNRVLVRQELVFLGHLMRVLSGAPQAGYSPAGWTDAPPSTSAINARA